MLSLRRNSRIAWSFSLVLSVGMALLSCDDKQVRDDEEESDESPKDSEDQPEQSKKSEESKGSKGDKESPSPGEEQPGASNDASQEDSEKDSKDGAGEGGNGEGSSDSEENVDPRPWFKFFATSQEGLVELADDKKNGFGGDLGGLSGADEICAKLAQKSNPGDTKTWRAFLSATADADGNPVHAIERVGEGPWHDYNKRLFAENVKGLLPGSDRRPAGADPQLAEMFTDEFGRPISPDTNVVDNHDMLTGSDRNGRLPSGATKAETCNDWTSKDTNLGKPRIGHAWPRSSRSGREWIYDHRAGGCGAGIDTEKKKGNGTPTVGSGGGYGGFYCFAL